MKDSWDNPSNQVM